MTMKEKLAVIGGLILLAGFIWGIFNYVGKLATCEAVDKQFEMMKQTQQKQMEYIEQKTNKMEQLFDLKLLTQELKSVEEQIYRIEKDFGTSPRDPIKRADLEKLRRDRERIMAEIRALKEKK